jgi:NADH oxidoreductase Hcr
MWTLSLLCHDYYPYRAGQYALVSIQLALSRRCAPTLSSPGVSEYITLTIRRLDGGLGSSG